VNIKLATATLGAALILAGSPAFAADVQSGPIHINQLTLSGGYSADPNGDQPNILPGAVNISFTNQNTATATNVVFSLETHGFVIESFNDTGSFAPGVAIHHSFPEAQPSNGMRVAVAKATFADGTVWQNPDVPASLDVDTNVGVAVSRTQARHLSDQKQKRAGVDRLVFV
jgi:hypothetical protein